MGGPTCGEPNRGTELLKGIILVMMVIFPIMGMFMDWVGIVLLVMPVFLPIVMKLPVEELGFIGKTGTASGCVLVWCFVLYEHAGELLSPPWRHSPEICKTGSHFTDRYIPRVLPFICLQLLALAVLLIWPGIITLFLPAE